MGCLRGYFLRQNLAQLILQHACPAYYAAHQAPAGGPRLRAFTAFGPALNYAKPPQVGISSQYGMPSGLLSQSLRASAKDRRFRPLLSRLARVKPLHTAGRARALPFRQILAQLILQHTCPAYYAAHWASAGEPRFQTFAALGPVLNCAKPLQVGNSSQ